MGRRSPRSKTKMSKHAKLLEKILLGTADAKKEALLSLKEAPTFARAQDLLLAAIGRDR